MKNIVPIAIEEYCAAHTDTASLLLRELEEYTRTHCQDAQMLTGPVEGALLRLLIQVSGARRVLEIGTFTGYSALTMAEALPNDGRITTCEVNPEHARIAQSFFDRSAHGAKIEIRQGAALATIGALAPNARFDFVFLDADKENYVRYFEAVVPLLRPAGLLVADNTLWSGRVLDPKEKNDRAIATFNERVASDSRVSRVMLSVRDGVTVARKR
jgi:caffeoyl-CoA O-methyltransferase